MDLRKVDLILEAVRNTYILDTSVATVAIAGLREEQNNTLCTSAAPTLLTRTHLLLKAKFHYASCFEPA